MSLYNIFLISDLIDLIFPRHCYVCGEIMSRQEQDICLDCLYKLPKIEKIHLEEIEKVFWGKFDIASATSYIYYRKESPYNRLLHKMKYDNRPEIGRRLAMMAAEQLSKEGFFDGIDAIQQDCNCRISVFTLAYTYNNVSSI